LSAGFIRALILSPSIEVMTPSAVQDTLFWRHNRAKLFERSRNLIQPLVHWFRGQGGAGAADRGAVSDTVSAFLPISSEKYPARSDPAALCADNRAVREHSQKIASKYPHCSAKLIEVGMGTFIAETCACFAHRTGFKYGYGVFFRKSEDLELYLNAVRHLAMTSMIRDGHYRNGKAGQRYGG